MKVLLIEDEPEISELISNFLKSENYLVEKAVDYRSAQDKIASFDYDCILLDIMLPDGNGLSLLKELAKMDKSDGVIIISAKNSIDDKVKGLELGADDYLTKPFHMAELNARIKSVLRRKNGENSSFVELNNVKISFDERLAKVDEQVLDLNRKEFDILVFLATNKNRIVSKSAIAENIWGDYIDQADDFDFIYSQVKNLRKKLRTYQAQIEIATVYGIGYKLTTK
ncbi:response regulator transcription factor [uncultured Draconibacterium sp.]|uniref:response regulator transcription factor n=1 Tax=uncultured Draconibacterium sp. TaxID=1573823 RepID=UPI0025CF40BF|nr:response regulator transcription factor [uncultured Draconibacterium sp.]